MNTWSSRVGFAVIVGALALVIAGCGSATVAATVNGVDITNEDVLGLTTGAEDESTADGQQVRSLLTNQIVTVAMLTAAADDLGLGDLSSSESTQAYLAGASDEEIAILESVSSDPTLTESAIDLVTVQLNIRSSVIEAITTEGDFLQDLWQNGQDLLTRACARHVLVLTQEEAQAARDRVDAGEDFSAVATEVSLDAQSPGGAFPCPVAPGSFPPQLATVMANAPVGQVVGPLETQFGWHIVIVDTREAPATIEELAQDPLKWIPPTAATAAWTAWLNSAIDSADIEVRSQIGTWSPPVNAIVPPQPSP